MNQESLRTVLAGDYSIYIGPESLPQLKALFSERAFTQVFVLTDSHTYADCYPRLAPLLPAHSVLSVSPGELHKTLDSCQYIWQALTDAKADRGALLLNLGGGLIGDLGGFAASCYKRGIDFIQVPTSLLAMVDASAGGKTGVNFDHFKNQVGVFRNPKGVFIDPAFLETLPPRELRSGFAELLKHCLIADATRWQRLAQADGLPSDWTGFIAESIQVKVDIVTEDPFEKGPRKALNFGHTVGHAVESHFMEQEPLLHGEAVALGMVCEAHISATRGHLNEAERDEIAATILRYYGHRPLPESEYPALLQLVLQDKKNIGGQVMCTLLNGIGDFLINQTVTASEFEASFTYYNSLPA